MNPTAYIQTPTTGKDIPPPGWVIVLTKEGKGMHFYCTGTDLSLITMRDQYDWWLKPVDISRMLEEAWEAAEKRRKFYEKRVMGLVTVINNPNEPPDKATYINSVLNPPK